MNELDDSFLDEIDALLDEVLDLAEEDRIPYLKSTCKYNRMVCDEVIFILQSAQSTPGILAKNVFQVAPSLVHEFTNEAGIKVIPRINDFEILEEIGHGGMGIVYKAKQISLGRFVAIKVLSDGLKDTRLDTRFQLEQKILSNLEHPNIARLYEIGTTDDERPYFAMEFIDGIHLDEFCNRNSLPFKERILKFIEVAEAISFAHSKGIIHRDVKPSNILVSKKGNIKLVDFGIAQPIEKKTKQTQINNHQERLFTPIYAAPEQIKGEPISVETDVYQLGMVLYKLLTGHLPYPINNLARDKVEKLIIQHPPIRPSSSIKREDRFKSAATLSERDEKMEGKFVGKLAKALRGDLDAILLKSLCKEPIGRYRSVDSFIEDINRYLTDFPVRVRSDTLTYRLEKFTRRHMIPLLIATLFLFILTSFATTFINQQIKVNREAARANLAREYVLNLFMQFNPLRTQGRSISSRELIYSGVDGLNDLNKDPLLKANVMRELGELSYHMALPEQAESLLASAVIIFQNEYDPNHLLIAEAHHWLGMVLIDMDKSEEAIPYLESALRVRESRLKITAPAILESRSALADAHMRLENYKDAEKLLTESLKFRDTPSLFDHHEIFSSIDGMARIRFYQARVEQDSLLQAEYFKQAEQLFLDALQLRMQHLGSLDLRTAHTQYGLADLLLRVPNYQEAIEYYRSALHVYEHVLKDSSDLIALAQFGLASSLARLDSLERAEYYFLESAEMYEKSLGIEHALSGWPWVGLGDLYVYQENWQEAKKALTRSEAIFNSLEEKNDFYLHFGQGLLGHVFYKFGEIQKAKTYLRSSIHQIGVNGKHGQRIASYLADVLESEGNLTEAANYREQSD